MSINRASSRKLINIRCYKKYLATDELATDAYANSKEAA